MQLHVTRRAHVLHGRAFAQQQRYVTAAGQLASTHGSPAAAACRKAARVPGGAPLLVSPPCAHTVGGSGGCMLSYRSLHAANARTMVWVAWSSRLTAGVQQHTCRQTSGDGRGQASALVTSWLSSEDFVSSREICDGAGSRKYARISSSVHTDAPLTNSLATWLRALAR